MSSEYEQQLEKRNEELQSKLSALESKHLEMETFSVDLTHALVKFIKKLHVTPTEGHPYDDKTRKLGAIMEYKYLVREEAISPADVVLKKLLDARYEHHLAWQAEADKSLAMVQKCDKMISIERTEGSNEPFYVTKITHHEE